MEKFFVKWLVENGYVDMVEVFDTLAEAQNCKAEWDAQAVAEEWFGKAIIERVDYEWDWATGGDPEDYEWDWHECGGEIVG